MNSKRVDKKILFRCGDYLSSQHLKLVCAESMSAGFLSSIWALEVSSGDYFLGSIVCYDERIKERLLQVPSNLIEKYTAESTEVTLAMLQGLEGLVPQADVYISLTGLSFPSPNPKQNRPAGRVYYAFSYKENRKIFEKQIKGRNAGEIIIGTCNSILKDLYNWLNGLNT